MELPQNAEITDKFEQLVQILGDQCEDSDRKHKETQEMLDKVLELLQNLHVKQPNTKSTDDSFE